MTVIDDRFDTTGPSEADADSSDRDLIARAQEGDASAYAALYERHHDAVRRVARRLARDEFEADDVVSEVFANTLRAVKRGRGPRDDFAAYALRSVRNTVTKLRTRTDSARAAPTDERHLDRPVDDDALRVAGDVEQAFTELPARFRSVLWSTCIEGHAPSDVATPDVDAGAVASLSNRARRPQGRSYLRVHTRRPCRQAECARVRSFLPGYVQHSAAAGTTQRIESHLTACSECRDVCDEMTELNGKLRTTGWWSLFVAAARQLVAAVDGPIIATAATPIVALVVAGTVVHHEPVDDSPGGGVGRFVSSESIDPPGVGDVLAVTALPPSAGGAAAATVSDEVAGGVLATTAATVTSTGTSIVTSVATTSTVATAPTTNAGTQSDVATSHTDTDNTSVTHTVSATPVTSVVAPVTSLVPAGETEDDVRDLGDLPSELVDTVDTLVDDTTDLVGTITDEVTDAVVTVGAVVGLDLEPVADAVDDVVDEALGTTDVLVGAVTEPLGAILAPTTTSPVGTTPTTTPATVPDLVDELVGGLGGLLGG